jgi:predicted nuclease with TOPRIM domain
MGDLKNADQSFAEYREKFAQMDDENKQLQRLLDDATLKREHAQDRLRSLEVRTPPWRPCEPFAPLGRMQARQEQLNQTVRELFVRTNTSTSGAT